MLEIERKLGKEDFNHIMSLYSIQPWLCEKEVSLIELILMCETNEHKNLVVDLLSEFKCPDMIVLNTYLNLISEFIITDSGYSEGSTQIASITFNDEADSSQKVLDYIKIPLFQQGWDRVKTVNRFGDIPKNYKKGLNQIILIDEFIGSGKTILNRIRDVKEYLKKDFELKFCFIAGMDHGIKKIEELGYEVFCPLRLHKGISERFGSELSAKAIQNMKEIEAKLALQINEHDLNTFSMGYNDAQALYSLESCLGNTPNSVFPLFWWPRCAENKQRKTLLTRVERGLK
jgi:hypothetical protein